MKMRKKILFFYPLYFLAFCELKAQSCVTITQPSPLQIQCQSTSTTSSNTANGVARVVVNGGTPPYSYVWNNGQTAQHLINIPKGIYHVEVKDANGCLQICSTTVQENCVSSKCGTVKIHK
jgi:hypothetical protein